MNFFTPCSHKVSSPGENIKASLYLWPASTPRLNLCHCPGAGNEDLFSWNDTIALYSVIETSRFEQAGARTIYNLEASRCLIYFGDRSPSPEGKGPQSFLVSFISKLFFFFPKRILFNHGIVHTWWRAV